MPACVLQVNGFHCKAHAGKPWSGVKLGVGHGGLWKGTAFKATQQSQMKVPCPQENHPFPCGNGMAVEKGDFAYPKASGPKFEFSDDEDDEDHDDEDESNDEDHKGNNKKKNGKDEAPEPKVGSCISEVESLCSYRS